MLIDRRFVGENTIRFKVLKIGTVIVRYTCCIRPFFSSAFPDKDLLSLVCQRVSHLGAASAREKQRG